jgi:small conductance mechanosensitive channel
MRGMIDWDKLFSYAIQYGINIVAALIIFIIGKWIARLASNLAERLMLNAKINRTLATFTKHMVYFGMLAFVIIAALNKLGIETNSFIAIIGAAGLAVGLALQGALANFAAGVMLIMFQPFQVDDLVEAGERDTDIQYYYRDGG